MVDLFNYITCFFMLRLLWGDAEKLQGGKSLCSTGKRPWRYVYIYIYTYICICVCIESLEMAISGTVIQKKMIKMDKLDWCHMLQQLNWAAVSARWLKSEIKQLQFQSAPLYLYFGGFLNATQVIFMMKGSERESLKTFSSLERSVHLDWFTETDLCPISFTHVSY